MAETIQYYGTGRRKTAIARVYLRPGSGDFTVNGRAFEEYFVTPSQRVAAKQPLASTETAATFNVLANVSGGGVDGQADAVQQVTACDQPIHAESAVICIHGLAVPSDFNSETSDFRVSGHPAVRTYYIRPGRLPAPVPLLRIR